MSKIEKMIAKLCPNGVTAKEIEAVLSYERPDRYIVKSTRYNNEYAIPVLTAGDTFVLGYTDEEDGVYQASTESPVIIFDDFTTSFHWVDFPFKVKSSAMKMLTPKDDVNFKYIYYVMKCISYKPFSHARQWISVYQKFKIPVPPIEIQHEIVKILDKFTSLQAELQAELQARRAQYNHYRDALLAPSSNTVYKTLGQIGKRNKGTNITAAEMKELHCDGAPIRIFAAGNTIADVNEGVVPESNVIRVPSIIVKSRGYIGFEYCTQPFSHKNEMWSYTITDKDVNQKYVYYYLTTQVNKLQELARCKSVKLPQLSTPDTDNLKIPLPPIAEQNRIVEILARFDTFVNDISIGLPAEIDARKQQYEYYRNKLLTFDEAS